MLDRQRCRPPGEVVFISELVKENKPPGIQVHQPLKCDQSVNQDQIIIQRTMEDRSVRVLGRLIAYDPVQNLATIAHKNDQMHVDTSLLGVFPHTLGKLYLYFGQLIMDYGIDNKRSHCIEARIMKEMEGLDELMYERAVHLQRRFQARVFLE